jgi:regulator of sirC expression with transglutaminase-like and TPR domain
VGLAFDALVRTPEEHIDLARTALLIARVEVPDLEPDPWLARLDDLAERSGARRAGDADSALTRLRQFLFDEEGFRGNAEDYFDPLNSCLDQVIDRRLGIPITLSLLTMEVGRRAGLDIEGVGLPGHFIVRANLGARRVLFDPFHGGRILSEADAADVVTQAMGQPVPLTDAHFAPVTKLQILTRMLANLKSIYVNREQWPKALQVIDGLLSLDARGAGQRRDRGTVLMKLGDFRAGAAEWERYLVRYPQARDADKVRGQLRRIRQALASLN